MLYKKVHRQFIRQFRRGRKFKIDDEEEIRKILKEPYIEKVNIGVGLLIFIVIDCGDVEPSWNIILDKTGRVYDNRVTWLD